MNGYNQNTTNLAKTARNDNASLVLCYLTPRLQLKINRFKIIPLLKKHTAQ